jgi:hypothetical protein
MCSICAQTLGRVRGSELAEVPKGPEFTEITWRRVQKEHHSGSSDSYQRHQQFLRSNECFLDCRELGPNGIREPSKLCRALFSICFCRSKMPPTHTINTALTNSYHALSTLWEVDSSLVLLPDHARVSLCARRTPWHVHHGTMFSSSEASQRSTRSPCEKE